MSTKKELVVTFRLDASNFMDEGGVQALAFARDAAWNLIFKRAEINVLEARMRAAVHPSGNDVHDMILKSVLEEEIKAIRAAALSATYEIIETSIQEE